MHFASKIANQLRSVHFGGNWTSSCLKEHISDITWEEAILHIGTFNSIASLTFHMNYYIEHVSTVLEGGPLNAKDECSYDRPPIESEKDWIDHLNKIWDDAERFAQQIEGLTDEQLSDTFVDPIYGTVFDNLIGIIEHCHYHLGQIVLIKKIMSRGGTNANFISIGKR